MSAITVEVRGADAVVAHLQAMSDEVRKALLRAVTQEAIIVQGRVREKLAGEVLAERTHHLHDSIHYEMREDSGSIIARVGTDIVYAAFHEYGFSGAEQVRAHLRRQSMAFGRPIAPIEVMVAAHTRQVEYAPRSFLRSTLEEKAAEIRAALEAAVHQAITR